MIAIGDVDEANSAIGLAGSGLAGALEITLARIQNDLFDLGADLATPYLPDEAEGVALRITVSGVDCEQSTDPTNPTP